MAGEITTKVGGYELIRPLSTGSREALRFLRGMPHELPQYQTRLKMIKHLGLVMVNRYDMEKILSQDVLVGGEQFRNLPRYAAIKKLAEETCTGVLPSDVVTTDVILRPSPIAGIQRFSVAFHDMKHRTTDESLYLQQTFGLQPFLREIDLGHVACDLEDGTELFDWLDERMPAVLTLQPMAVAN